MIYYLTFKIFSEMPATTLTNEISNSRPELVTVPYYPWFMDHVKTSLLKKSFSSLYFTVGLVEEVGELADELKKKDDLQSNEDNVVSEVGELADELKKKDDLQSN